MSDTKDKTVRKIAKDFVRLDLTLKSFLKMDDVDREWFIAKLIYEHAKMKRALKKVKRMRQ